MPARQYPFIDIAVHARVREHFARGDAAILFSRDFERILWANDQGAAFFGAGSIYDFIDAGPNQGDLSLRQLRASAAQLSKAGDRRQLSIRKFSGFRGTPLSVTVEMIRVRPDEDAVLFTAPHTGAPLSLQDRAARMIAGLDGPDTHMAVLDGDGGIVAHSPGFIDLGMSGETRKQLVDAVGRDHDWLIKRPVATRKGQLPAAVGKIADDPSLHLLFAVETILGTLDADEPAGAAELPEIAPLAEAAAQDADVPAAVAANVDETQAETIPAQDAGSDVTDERPVEDTETTRDDEAPTLAEDDLDSDRTLSPVEPETPAEMAGDAPDDNGEQYASESQAAPAMDDLSSSASAADFASEAIGAETSNAQRPDDPKQETLAEQASHSERIGQAAHQPGDTEQAGHADQPGHADQAGFTFTPGGRAVRFVWKIDAEGRFSEISEEFATAVGPRSAGVIGETFADVAGRYDLDPEHRINALLQRRDTWSGKTIFWPIEGTSLKVPVDLAALPTYSRSREFDGFRGFGIVRLADAVEDENANGLSFTTEAVPAMEADPESVDPQQQAERDARFGAADEPAAVDAEDEQAPSVQPQPDVAADGGTEPALPLFAGATDVAHSGDDEDVPGHSAAAADPFQGERPVLRVVATPDRPDEGKVVELEQHRTLTRGEQAAFREIARQLGGKPTDAEALPEPIAEAAEEQPAPAEPTASTPTDAAAAVAGEPQSAVSEPAAEQARDDDAGVTEDGIPQADEQPAIADIGLSGEILDSLPIGMLVHRGDRLLHANPEFLRLTAYDDLGEFMREGGIDALFANGEEATDQDADGTMTLIRKDGQLRPVIARLHSIRWDGKSALMLALTPAGTANVQPANDDRAVPADQHVDRLKTEIDELKSILETATDGVVILGHDGDIRSMNRSASALFNYDEAEIRGKPFAALFAHESQKAVLDYLHGLSGHGVASVLNDGREVIGREAAGGFIPLFMTIGRLSASNGFCAVIRDITQWKRTEEELRNAKRAAETANAHKTEFLARVSHEIRTPLNAIIGFSDMMASEHFGPVGHPRYIEYAGDIGRSGRHVLDIVNDLLDISKIEAGEMELDFGAVEINEAVSEAVSLVQPQANSQRVIIRTSLSAAVPNVVADGRSIKQIALNILANAIRFTPSGGQIVVSTSYEANGSVILRIRDTGVGMTRNELEQAMKPFRQVTTGARKRGDGTGLGLPLTKAMAEANRAQFAITSAPNEGTLVEISFPSQRVLAN
ncbi:ATP-binding protein [Ensifer sp.]|jgi:PAS domain S-box-containing protein|uniref:ATP-binding protein n=1 Tax=Ensifer sp. TaxID=1872086 RepID=UPI002E0D750E|nr:ATP-binding protein [Ensifer sp.]